MGTNQEPSIYKLYHKQFLNVILIIENLVLAIFVSGYVAMIMNFKTQIELYSPSGKCNQNIANPPISTMYNPVLSYV